MHDGGAPCIDCAETARDCRVKPSRIGDPFPMRSEGAAKIDETPLLARMPAAQPGQEGVRPLRGSLRVDPLDGCLHGLPAAIVENDGEDRQAILLRHGIDGIGRGKMEGAVAHDLHHTPAGWIGEPEAKGHAAAEANWVGAKVEMEPAPGPLRRRKPTFVAPSAMSELNIVCSVFDRLVGELPQRS